ncbi:MAG: response regulator transcription factor [Anaerolineales bacterium]|nr:response regulator transcription factor [Anaerolineales bacterium]MBP6210865.1 response regulator transcription factor [Anaerolineales bacterium]
MDKIRLVIVDDHPIFREGVASILGSEPDIEILGQGVNADDAVRLTRDLLPDVILMDVNMPGDGLKAVEVISASYPVVKIILLTGVADEDIVMSALKSGAQAYVLKGVAARELKGILHTVYNGEGYVSPSLAANLLSEITSPHRQPQPARDGFDDLTDRERQILELIAVGTSNKEIGQKLFLTEKTVKHYVTNILQKLHVRNRVQAALIAQEKTRPRPGA